MRKALFSVLSVPHLSAFSVFMALRDFSTVNLFLDEENPTADASATAGTNPKQGQEDIMNDKDGGRAASDAEAAAQTRGEEKGIEHQDSSSSRLCENITHEWPATSSTCVVCQLQDLGIIETRILAKWDPR